MGISVGKKKLPYKVVVYGPEGIGKTTFASKFPGPIFIDTEGSTARMDVARYDDINTLDDVIAAIDHVKSLDFETLVIDTGDKLELLINEAVCKEQNVTGIEAVGYGKGYVYAMEKLNKILGKLDALRMAKGMHIVIVCHAQMRKFEQPDEMGAYDRWELKLSKKSAPILKEWADMVLFANYKTYVVMDDKTKSKKAQGGKRVMYSEHNPCWDAKNRDGLPSEMAFDFECISHLFNEKKATTGQKAAKKEAKKEPAADGSELIKQAEEKVSETNAIRAELEKKMEQAHFTEGEVICTFHEKGKFPGVLTFDSIDDWDFIKTNVLGNWQSFSNGVKKYGLENPFVNHWEDLHPKEEEKK